MKQILIFLFCFFSTQLLAQYPASKFWDYRYGSAGNDIPQKLIKTLDNGFLLCGSSASNAGFEKSENTRGGWDYWVVKVDSNGIKLWDKRYGGSQDDYLTCALALPDSGFLLGGRSISDTSHDKLSPNVDPIGAFTLYDYWIIRIDKNGNRIWDRDYGGLYHDFLTDIKLLNNGNFILVGESNSDSSFNYTHHSYGDYDIWIICIDSLGNIIWDKNYGGMQSEFYCDGVTTRDNGYLITCATSSSISGSVTDSLCSTPDIYLVRIDSSGNQLWDKIIGGDLYEETSTLFEYSMNKFIIGGFSNSNASCEKTESNFGVGAYDFWMICVDSLGNIVWDKIYGGVGDENHLGSITLNSDGFLISGTSQSDSSGNKTTHNVFFVEQPWVISVDSMGNIQWQRTLDNPTPSAFCSGMQTDDGCYVFLSTATNGGGDVSVNRNSGIDYWLVKYCSSNLPLALFTHDIFLPICENSCMPFTNHSQNASSFTWLFPGGTPPSSTQTNPPCIGYSQDGIFDVILIATNAYGSDTLLMPGAVTVLNTPQIGLFQSGDTIFTAPGYAHYQWKLNSITITGANNYFYVATLSGDYTVIVTDTSGCGTSANLLGVVTSIQSIENNSPSAYYSNGKLMLNAKPDPRSVLKIVDSSGKEIFKTKNPERQIAIGFLSSGIYFVSIETPEKFVRLKLLVSD